VMFSYLHFIIVALFVVVVHYIFGLYRSVWSFAGTDEFVRGLAAAAVDMGLLMFTDRLVFESLLHIDGRLPFWRYIFGIIVDAALIIGIRFGYRILRRSLAFRNVDNKTDNKRVMIVGAGFMGNFVIETLRNDAYKDGKPIVALDDNPSKYRKVINGVKVVGVCNKIPELVHKYKIDEVILSLPSAPQERQRELMNLAMQTNAKVKISPSITEMFEEGGNRRIRKVDIADLLSRPEVKLDKKVCRYLIGKTVLVTGGGGSIGAELCTQVARYDPKTIVIFDIYENCAFELQNELKENTAVSLISMCA
ncbi:MAG: polysaccharide biosynthesis protein, partial [Eubacterium sp.]|nr:polysaccharide biosynthesis protein [Eubacterium sp.]